MLMLCVLAGGASAQPGVWSLLPSEPPGNPVLYAAHFRDAGNGLVGLVGGDDNGTGVLYRTINGGASWTAITLPGSPTSINDMFFLQGSGAGFIAGNANYFAATTDGGLTWIQRSVPATMWGGSLSDLQGVHFQNLGRGWVVGRRASGTGPRMAITPDAGRTWTEVPMNPPANNLYDIDFADDAHGIVVGTGGPTRKSVSTDGGFSWEANATMGTIPPAASTSFYGVDAIYGSSIAFTAGGQVVTSPRYPMVRRTTDYGATWSNVLATSTPGLNDPARDVVALGDTVMYVAGENAGLVRTTNGGTSWTAETVPALGSEDLMRFSFTDDNYVFAVGSSGAVIRTRLVPDASFSVATSLDFGLVCPDAVAQRTIMIGNTGLGALRVAGYSIDQPVGGWVEYEIAVPNPSLVWPRQTEPVRINVRVASGAPAGLHTGNIHIATNDENSRGADTFRTIALTVNVRANGVVIDSTISRDAGFVRLGSVRTLAMPGILRNVSADCKAIIDSVYLASGLEFRILRAPLHDTLRASERRTIDVEFRPTSTCFRSDTLVVLQPGKPPFRIAVSGTALEAAYSTTPSDTLRFGGVQIGSTQPATLTLVNRKARTCLDRTALSSLTIAGPNAAEFATAVRFTPGTSFIPPDSSLLVAFTATPSAAGPRIAYAIITHELSAVPDTVVLLVRGMNADIASSIDEIVFPVTEVGTRDDSTIANALRNVGNSPVTITAANVTGVDRTAFVLSSPSAPLALAGGATDSIVIAFMPGRVGMFNAVLELQLDNGSTIAIRLEGEGDVASGELGQDSIVIASTPIDDCRRTTVERFIRNTGRVPLRVRALTIGAHLRGVPADASSFAVISPVLPPERVIAPGDSLAIVVEFCATRLGEHLAMLNVASNIPGAAPGDTLIATGIESSVTAVDEIVIAATRVGTIRTVTIDPFFFNDKNSGLQIVSIGIAGSDAPDFALIAPTPPLSLAPDSTVPVQIRFAPTSRGLKRASLVIESSRGIQMIPITGRGIYPHMSIAKPAPLRVLIGQQSPLVHWIHNTGDDSGSVSSVAVAGSADFVLVPAPLPATIAAGDSIEVQISFAPTARCLLTDTLRLTAEGAAGAMGAADTAIVVEGIGIAPMLSSGDTVIVFGNVFVNTTSDSLLPAFVLNGDRSGSSNLCVAATSVDALSIGGVDAGSFEVVAPIDHRASLDTGAAYPMTIRFRPTRVGLHSALLEVHYDGVADSVLRVLLVGSADALPEFNAGISFGADHEVRPGDRISIPLTLLGDVTQIELDSIAIDIAYHQSLLRFDRVVPSAGIVATAAQTVYGADTAHTMLSITSPAAMSSGPIAMLEFTVLLGRVLVSDVRADTAYVPGRSNIHVLADSALVSIEDFCYANGRRVSFGGELLLRATPNPTTDVIQFEYDLPATGTSRLKVFDDGGAEVATILDGDRNAGHYVAELDVRALASGVYYCVLTSGRFSSTLVVRVAR